MLAPEPIAQDVVRPAVPMVDAGTRFMPASQCQSLSRSPFAAVNVNFFDAAMVMAAPLAGLRP